MNPYLLSAGANVLASLFGNRSANRYNSKSAARANQAARENQAVANRFNVKQANLARQHDQRMYQMARKDAIDAGTRDFSRNMAAMDKANAFTANQAQQARAHDVHMNRLARKEALQDQAEQFTRMRSAAEAAGINPLSALGVSQMVPAMQGLTSSSFGASAAPPMSMTQTPGAPATASVPMSYGAPVSVAPVASNDAVVGAVAEFGREVTGIAAVERANAQFFADVARLEAERLQAGLSAPVFPTVPPGGGAGAIGPTAVPVGPMSTSGNSGFDWRDGYFGGRHAPSPNNPEVPTEVRPEPYGTGLSWIRNRFLPEFGRGPYIAAGDTDEVFQLDGLPVNAPLIGGQMAYRVGAAMGDVVPGLRGVLRDGISALTSGFVYPDNFGFTSTGGIVREFVPSLGGPAVRENEWQENFNY